MIGFKILNHILKKRIFKIYIDYPRDELIQRIGKRAEQMIEIGAINEVKGLLN